jgi:hypothetical protein
MQTQQDDGRPRGNALTWLMVGCFLLLGAVNLLNRDWLSAALFLLGGLTVLKGREIDRWPRAPRYLFVLAVAALAVALFVRIVLRLRAVM